jgi:hypothetical protein
MGEVKLFNSKGRADKLAGSRLLLIVHQLQRPKHDTSFSAEGSAAATPNV